MTVLQHRNRQDQQLRRGRCCDRRQRQHDKLVGLTAGSVAAVKNAAGSRDQYDSGLAQ